jgi:hypothetical protein
MQTLLQDLRYGARMLFKQPGFSLIAVLTLALGIGANTTVFSVVNAVLLRPLPYAQADRLVMIWGNFLKLNIERLPAKAAEYLDYRDQTKSFAGIAAFDSTDYNLAGDSSSAQPPERIAGTKVTTNLFATLEAQVAHGRGFITEDSQPGHENVVIASHAFWQRRFGGAPDLVGKTLRLNEQNYTVVGIMPVGFQFPHASFPFGEVAELWTPLVFTAEQATERQPPYFLNVVARLKPDARLEQARAELSALGQQFETQYPGYQGPNNADGGWRITVNALPEEVTGKSRRALLLLLGAVELVLLMACANVANLLLMRATVRQREWAIRAAVGASRWQIMRQLLCESLWLATLGGAAGLLLAWWGIEALTKWKLDNLPRVTETNLDGRVLTFTLLSSMLTGLLYSLQRGEAATKEMMREYETNENNETNEMPFELSSVGKNAAVRELFDALVASLQRCGPIMILPEKTRIAFQVRMSFAAVSIRRAHIVGHFVLARRLDSPRFVRIETYSPRNYGKEVFRQPRPATSLAPKACRRGFEGLIRATFRKNQRTLFTEYLVGRSAPHDQLCDQPTDHTQHQPTYQPDDGCQQQYKVSSFQTKRNLHELRSKIRVVRQIGREEQKLNDWRNAAADEAHEKTMKEVTRPRFLDDHQHTDNSNHEPEQSFNALGQSKNRSDSHQDTKPAQLADKLPIHAAPQ